MGAPKLFTWNGHTKNIRQWADHFGVDPSRMAHAIHKGLTFEQMPEHFRAFEEKRRITVNGVTMNKRQWAAHLGIHECVIYDKLNKGMTMEEIVQTPRAPRPGRRKGAKDRRPRKQRSDAGTKRPPEKVVRRKAVPPSRKEYCDGHAIVENYEARDGRWERIGEPREPS